MKNLRTITTEVYEVNLEKGWFEQDRSFEEGLVLIVTELAEAVEAYREHGLEDATLPGLDAKPEGVGSELADVLIRIADQAQRDVVDLDHFVALFAGRPSYQLRTDAPFGEQVMHLVRRVTRIEPSNPGPGLARLTRDLLTVAESAGVDIEAEYERKIAFNRTRPARHGGKRL